MLDSFIQLINTKKIWIYPQHQVRKGILSISFLFFFKEISNYCLTSINLFLLCQTPWKKSWSWLDFSVLFFFVYFFIRFCILDTHIHLPFSSCIRLSLSPIPHCIIPLNCLAFLLFAIDNLFHHIFTLLCYLTAFPVSYFQFSDIFPKLKSAFDILVGKLSIVDMDTSIFLLKSLSSKHKTVRNLVIGQILNPKS